MPDTLLQLRQIPWKRWAIHEVAPGFNRPWRPFFDTLCDYLSGLPVSGLCILYSVRLEVKVRAVYAGALLEYTLWYESRTPERLSDTAPIADAKAAAPLLTRANQQIGLAKTGFE